jgi:hypothetical protein
VVLSKLEFLGKALKIDFDGQDHTKEEELFRENSIKQFT